MNSNYNSIKLSKTQKKLPLANNFSFHSSYNPEKEAETFASQFSNEELFFVVGGIAGGFHLKSLIENNKNRKIIAVENSIEDIEYLKQLEIVKNLFYKNQIIFCTPENLVNAILENYIPQVYGKLTLTFLRSWKEFFYENSKKIEIITQTALKNIKNDYSVQTRFAKTWNFNFFNNLKQTSKQIDFNSLLKINFKNKKAAIIAAGPTLDYSIKELKKDTEKYTIFCVDTTFPVLLKHSIIPDFCISLDGQNASVNHFHNLKNFPKKTIFALDLTANLSITQKLAELSLPFFFFESGHPLCRIASNFEGGKSFPSLKSGLGTVTCAALSLAKLLGFEEFTCFGADFSYNFGKPYCKGTYLDDLYSIKQNILSNTETEFSRLLFRTELFKQKNNFTTELLMNYKKSFEELKISEIKKETKINKFNSEKFLKMLKEKLFQLNENPIENLSFPFFYSLLPLMAFYEQDFSIKESFELARKKTLLYTE